VKALRGLKDTVPSIASITVQDALNPGDRSFDGLLEAHFQDADGYQAYLADDSHIAAWLNYLQPVSTELASIQVEHRGQLE
jgi:hypothetical protein